MKKSRSYFLNSQNLTNPKQESASYMHTPLHPHHATPLNTCDPFLSFHKIIPQLENTSFISPMLVRIENFGIFCYHWCNRERCIKEQHPNTGQLIVPEGNSRSGWVSQYLLFRIRETRMQQVPSSLGFIKLLKTEIVVTQEHMLVLWLSILLSY